MSNCPSNEATGEHAFSCELCGARELRERYEAMVQTAANLSREADQLRATNKRLNRRAQSAESALDMRVQDWNKRSTDAMRNHYYDRTMAAEADAALWRALYLQQRRELHRVLQAAHAAIDCEAWPDVNAQIEAILMACEGAGCGDVDGGQDESAPCGATE